jgi:hypothetical protein
MPWFNFLAIPSFIDGHVSLPVAARGISLVA